MQLRLQEADQKVKYAQSLIEATPELDEPSTEQSECKESFTDEDFRDMFKVLKRQKEGLDILTNSVNENTRQLMVMEREVEIQFNTKRCI